MTSPGLDASDFGPAETGALARGAKRQARVVSALILRETRTRFGRHRLGYLWALVEPVALIAMLLVVFQLAGRSSPAGLDAVGFLTTGLIPYLLFIRTASRGAPAINANRAML